MYTIIITRPADGRWATNEAKVDIFNNVPPKLDYTKGFYAGFATDDDAAAFARNLEEEHPEEVLDWEIVEGKVDDSTIERMSPEEFAYNLQPDGYVVTIWEAWMERYPELVDQKP